MKSISNNTSSDRAQSIFLDALEIESEQERAAFVNAECGTDATLLSEVNDLLDHAGRLGQFLASDGGSNLPTIDHPIAEKPGTMIGPYKIREQLGEGGFGVVYVAEQEKPIARKVALKIIKPGMDTKEVVARFAAEQQALGLMNHPNVAKVLDAGATETGRPYFVMELVYGCPITDFCDQQRLTNRERLQLFLDVCRAVQHAHQKGIIHRDIKPSNVMVTMHDDKPVPKVIDFGVAKALSRKLTDQTIYTAYHHIVGTPLYMSPEQAQMSGVDIDTRSDVYSLGVLLYELLTGTTPFDKETLKSADIDELRRIICEAEPPRPSDRISTLHNKMLSTVADRRQVDERSMPHSLRGDLDWIIMRAMEKDRNRRYESASALAADIERYLNDEPVTARQPSLAYRTRKFLTRHKARFATCAFVLLSLVTCGGILAWNRYQRGIEIAREQTHQQQREIELSRSVGESLAAASAVFDAGDYAAVDRHLTEARTRLEVAQYREGPLKNQVTQIVDQLAGKRMAQKRFDDFQAIRHRVHSNMYSISSDMRYKVREQCVQALSLYGVMDDDEWQRGPQYQRLTAHQKNTILDSIVEILFIWARSEFERGRGEPNPAMRSNSYRQGIHALSKLESLGRPIDSLYLWIAAYWREVGEGQKAEEAAANAAEMAPSTAFDYFVQGEFHALNDDWDMAVVSYWHALNRQPDHFLSLLAAGVALIEQEEYGLAEAMLSGAIAVNPKSSLAYIKRAISRKSQGKEESAETDFNRAAELDPTSASSLNKLAWRLVTAKDREEWDPSQAVALAEQAVAMAPDNGPFWNTLGVAQYRAGDLHGALKTLRYSLKVIGDNPYDYFFLAMTYWQLGDSVSAKQSFDQAVSLMSGEAVLRRIQAEASALLGITQEVKVAARGTVSANDSERGFSLSGILAEPFIDKLGRRCQIDTRWPRRVGPVAIDPTCKYVAIGCLNQVRIYEMSSLQLVQVFCGHQAPVRVLAWSPDNRWLASGDMKGFIRIWDPHNGSTGAVLQAHSQKIWNIVWKHDSSMLASCAHRGDGVITIWQPNGDFVKAIPLGVVGQGLSWHPQKNWIACNGGGSRKFWVWDVTDGRLLHAGQHSADIQDLQFSPDGKLLAVAGGNRVAEYTIRIWNTKTWRQLHALSGHKATVRSIAWSPNANSLASVGLDSWVRIWDAFTGDELASLGQHDYLLGGSRTPAQIDYVSWSDDGRTVASAGYDNSLRLWNPETGKQYAVLAGAIRLATLVEDSFDRGHLCSVSPDGRLLAEARIGDNCSRIWSTKDLAQIGTLKVYGARLNDLGWSSDSRRLATANDNGRVSVIAVEHGSPRRAGMLSRDTDSVTSVAWSPINDQLASMGHARQLIIDSPGENGEERLEIGLQGNGAALAFAPSGKWIAIGARNEPISDDSRVRGEISVLDADTGEVKTVFENCDPGSVCWSPDGASLAVGRLGEIGIIEANTWRERGILQTTSDTSGRLFHVTHSRRPHDQTYSITWADDGTLFAAYGSAVEAWDATGKSLPPLTVPGGADRVAWCGDIDRLLVLTRDGMLRIWDWEARKEEFVGMTFTGEKSVVLDRAGNLIHGDAEVAERELIYLIESQDGSTLTEPYSGKETAGVRR